MVKGKPIFTPQAEKRLEQLRAEYRLAKKKHDMRRISQILYMANSIKAGELLYVYDFE